MARKLAAGNWKMNGSLAALSLIDAVKEAVVSDTTDVLICPPAPLLIAAQRRAAGSPVQIGAQNCHHAESGAHTGDVSAEMLADAGASMVIVGHSERRAAYGETDADVAAKASAAQRAGLTAIICLGESLAQRDNGEALTIIAAQLEGSVPGDSDTERLVIAYEPIWSIGTGHIPTPEQIAEVHALLRANLTNKFGAAAIDIPLLYGGSVKASNAPEIFALEHVDGALVGGASLKAEDFVPIVHALCES